MAHEKTLGRIIALPKYDDPRGNLTVADGQGGIPFPIARTYWITDVPGGESRGAHAHRQCREILVAVSGQAYGAHSKTSPRVPSASCWPACLLTRTTISASTTTTCSI